MKRLILTTAMLLALPAMASAQTATGTGTANSSSTSGAIAVGGGGGSARAGGGNASITFNNPGSTRSDNNTRIRQSGSLNTTPNAIAPGLGSAAIETCYGPGVSAGVSVTGFGASFGAGQYDTSCNRRLNARTVWAMGGRMRAVAIRIMAKEPEVQEAMAAEGLITLEPGDAAYRRPPAIQPSTRGAAPRLASTGCTKWSGGSPGAGLCVY